MRLAAEVAEPERQEAQLQVDEGVVAVGLGRVDHAALEREQPGRVRGRGQRIAETLELCALVRVLGRSRRGAAEAAMRATASTMSREPGATIGGILMRAFGESPVAVTCRATGRDSL